MKNTILFVGFILLMVSCNSNPEPIEYGQDKCDFCEMTIVEKAFAGELVTGKGKVHKFDAIECLVHSKQDHFKDTELTHELIMDFGNPGAFTKASEAWYLVSEEIKSPMGAHLAGFKEKSEAEETQKELGGKIYSWTEIQEHLKK